MKKLLIVQLDEAYFLYETLQVLEKNQIALKEFEITILANEKEIHKVKENNNFIFYGLTSNFNNVLNTKYDISFNLSLNEVSWDFHSKIHSTHKVGPYIKEGQLIVPDHWSTYLLTLKANAPFLTFHLQDIYKNILGIKRLNPEIRKINRVNRIVYNFFDTSFFSFDEQEKFINLIHQKFPMLPINEISEIDHSSDVSNILYIGPSSLDAVKLCDAGATGIIVSRNFQGFNLLPYENGHLFISTKGKSVSSNILFSFIDKKFVDNSIPENFPYSVYEFDHEHLFGAYLKCLNESDGNYPFYQSYVVLWNYVLSLFETNLDVIQCSKSQLELLKDQRAILAKFIRLHDYAMSALDSIYHEAKEKLANSDVIDAHIKQLKEVESISDKISQAYPLLRPILDFYRIRRAQNDGTTLLVQSENSLLNYSEEHSALQALDELFSVTLRKNEVNI
ncbi:MAG: hypothetical protein AB7I27_05130 [Bacteriovoracaceae bacterium]